MAMLPGKYSKIAFDRALKTVGLNGRKRPDVIGIARYGYNRIVEVVSKSQTVLQMEKKCESMLKYNFKTKKTVVGWPGKVVNFWRRLWK